MKQLCLGPILENLEPDLLEILHRLAEHFEVFFDNSRHHLHQEYVAHLLDLFKRYWADYLEERNLPQTAGAFAERHHDENVPAGKVVAGQDRRRLYAAGGTRWHVFTLAVFSSAKVVTRIDNKATRPDGLNTDSGCASPSDQTGKLRRTLVKAIEHAKSVGRTHKRLGRAPKSYMGEGSRPYVEIYASQIVVFAHLLERSLYPVDHFRIVLALDLYVILLFGLYQGVGRIEGQANSAVYSPDLAVHVDKAEMQPRGRANHQTVHNFPSNFIKRFKRPKT